jgi:hypothetical protein
MHDCDPTEEGKRKRNSNETSAGTIIASTHSLCLWPCFVVRGLGCVIFREGWYTHIANRASPFVVDGRTGGEEEGK